MGSRSASQGRGVLVPKVVKILLWNSSRHTKLFSGGHLINNPQRTAALTIGLPPFVVYMPQRSYFSARLGGITAASSSWAAKLLLICICTVTSIVSIRALAHSATRFQSQPSATASATSQPPFSLTWIRFNPLTPIFFKCAVILSAASMPALSASGQTKTFLPIKGDQSALSHA